jgi:hypothetical protein
MINELYGSAIFSSVRKYLDLSNRNERYGQIAINMYDVCQLLAICVYY